MNSNFFERVYAVVKDVPRGKVTTYGQIAKILGAPKWSQVVGYALHVNPDPKNILCHRVVNRFGALSGSFAFGGADEQKKRLLAEGVTFDKDGNVDMKKHLWRPSL